MSELGFVLGVRQALDVGTILLCLFCLLQFYRRIVRAIAERGHAELALLRGTRLMRENSLRNQASRDQASHNPALHEGRRRWTPAMGESVPTRNSKEPCLACQALCTECGGKGEHPCSAFGCGGRGFLVHSQQRCNGGPVDQLHPESCACEGSGMIAIQKQTCPVCKGTKIETCAVCQATGCVATGRDNHAPGGEYEGREDALTKGGIPAIWKWIIGSERHPGAPPCLECKGTGWQQETLNAWDRKNRKHAQEYVAQHQAQRV